MIKVNDLVLIEAKVGQIIQDGNGTRYSVYCSGNMWDSMRVRSEDIVDNINDEDKSNCPCGGFEFTTGDKQ